jgi:hypothetical protein
MADQYFIKRGDKVHGPYTGEQISSGIKSKKLTANDEVSVSENGPWNPLQAFYDTILNKKAAQVQVGSQAPNENQMRIVQQYQLKKNAFGKYTVKYKCPYCKEGLSSGEQELREGDHCPECRRPFRFSVDAIAQIESERQRKRDEKETVLPAPPLAAPPPAASPPSIQHFTPGRQKKKRPIKKDWDPQEGQRQKKLSGPGSDPSVADQGSLHFQRHTGITGWATKIKVLVDGQLKSKLAVNQSEQVAVSAGQHEIEVTGGGAFSGAKTTVSVTANSAHHFSIKYSAMGGLKLLLLESPGDSIEKEGLSLNDMADVVDGVSTLLDIFGDED